MIVNGADLQDPNDPKGRTYRQVNASKPHTIPVGSMVELDTGERLRVMAHARDCDETPLYELGVSGTTSIRWVRLPGDELTVIDLD